MKNSKSIYWLLIVIGLLSVAVSLYNFIQGKPFNDYFLSGSMGLLFAAIGFVYLRKLQKGEEIE